MIVNPVVPDPMASRLAWMTLSLGDIGENR